jgi:hypothetical protein
MEELDVEFWRNRGWKVPKDYIDNPEEVYIDYTFQYLLSIPISAPIEDKSSFLLGPLILEIQKELREDLKLEIEGAEILSNLRIHLGEIVDDEFSSEPSLGNVSQTCSSCGAESPKGFALCWLCGCLISDQSQFSSYVNVFIEVTGSTDKADLAEWQYDEGASRWAEGEWESIVRDYFVELSTKTVDGFAISSDHRGDAILTTEAFEIFVRFNPHAVRTSSAK